MNNTNMGPGVRKFWDARSRGEEVDVPAIVREYPDEAVAIADAIREAAIREDSSVREGMWLARARVLSRAGEDVSLGTLIRTSRQYAGLSTRDLSYKVRERGVSLPPTAIEFVEAGKVDLTNVKTAGLWVALSEILGIDRHRLVATIRGTLANPRSTQRFTRMDRSATPADRKGLLSGGLTSRQESSAASYISWVRAELGLPPSLDDTVQ